MKGLLCRALLSHRSAGGRWWRQPPKGGCISSPAGRLYGFRCPRQRHIKLPSEPARSVGRTHRSVRSTRTIEPGRRRRLNPQARQGLSISRQRRHKKWRPKGRPPRQRSDTIYLPRAGALNPSGRRQPVPDRTLAAQGQRPGGWLNPHARKGVSTFGNTGKHRLSPDPDPDRPKRRLNPQDPKGLVIHPVFPVSLPGLCILLRRGVLLWPLLWPGRRWRRPGGLCLRQE